MPLGHNNPTMPNYRYILTHFSDFFNKNSNVGSFIEYYKKVKKMCKFERNMINTGLALLCKSMWIMWISLCYYHNKKIFRFLFNVVKNFFQH